MNTIIQQFAEKITDDLKKSLIDLITNNKGNMSDIILTIKNDLDELGRELCSFVVEELDELIREDPKRKENWYIQRRNDKKKLITVFGEVEFNKTYFKSKKNGEYKYLVDEKLGLESHQKIDLSLQAEMIDMSTENSYKTTGKRVVNGVEISDQTVMNNIRNLKALDNRYMDDSSQKKEVPILYVEADEDHVALQNNSTIMPRLVYVHEGYENSGESTRKRLKNVYYFSGVYKNSEELWLEVADYIDSNYETEKIEQIFVAGDGASWIKEGLNWLPKSEYILDRYHLNKYVLKATGHLKKFRFKLWEALNAADISGVRKVFKEIMKETEKESKKNAVRKSRTYIYNNWEGIVNYLNEPDAMGCSAEGHVSHVLSDRLSSRPMGWSSVGTDQMARLRAFKYNKGTKQDIYNLLLSKQRERKKEKSLSNIISKMSVKKLKNRFIERKHNIPVFRMGKKTGLFNELRALS